MKHAPKRWHLYPQNPDLSHKLSQHLGTHPVIGQLLLNRNVRSIQAARSYLSPQALDHTCFPDTLMAPLAERLHHAITHNEHILIYGDYDVDGMTSTAILSSALRSSNATVSTHLPNRFKDGYGLNTSIIKRIQNERINLLITLDCGISNKAEIDAIKATTSADVLVFDHHTLPDELPAADGILNPKFLDPQHPTYNLCTAGIVYLFLQYFSHHFMPSLKAEDYIDLAALGTVADVVPLTDLNRSIVAQGLPVLSQRKRPGIRALLEVANCDRPALNVRDCGFVIAPRLNSSGRLGNPLLGVHLLTATHNDEALEIAHKLNSCNDERRLIGDSMLKAALAYIDEHPEYNDQHVLVLSGTHWHSGVIGITASRLCDMFSKPTIIIADDGQMGRGSARTIGDINIFDALNHCQPYFENFGGHNKAAGFSIRPDQIPAFQEALESHCKSTIDEQRLRAIIDIDSSLTPKDMTLDLAKQLETLEPFGEANPSPVFYTNELTAIDFRAVGDGSHVKATLTNKNESIYIDAIGFGLSHKMESLYNSTLEIAFNLEVNTWRGKEKVQLNLVDIK